MSRFVNLEFGNESEDQSLEGKPLVKDEAYYLAEARAAFENGNFESGLRLYSQGAGVQSAKRRRLDRPGAHADRTGRIPRSQALGRQGAGAVPARAGIAGRQGRGAGARRAICRGRWPFRTPPSRSAATRLTSGWRAATCCWRAKSRGPITASKRRCCWRRGDWFVAWLAARIRYYYEQFASALEAAAAGRRVERRPFPALAGAGPMPAGARAGRPGTRLLRARRGNSIPNAARPASRLTSSRELVSVPTLRGWWRRLFRYDEPLSTSGSG